jgi:hypothetical protein
MVLLCAFLLPLGILSADSSADTLSVDLLQMSRHLDVRYYIAERGELPPGYILIGAHEGHPGFIRPGFLEADFDLRRKTTEYDPATGLVFRYRVPKSYRFISREAREGVFYVSSPRDISIPGMEVEVMTIDEYNSKQTAAQLKQIWLDDIKYSLQRVTDDKPGRGLLSIDIPIDLPDQIEAIIGRGEATNLNVSGREKISLRGESNWCANCPQFEGKSQQQKFPELDMEQELTVDLNGTIGEKINVGIQHSSSAGLLEPTNRVKINYVGFEDEIIKLIEMGDTDLTLRGASLISYSQARQGLFGVKTNAQLGPLDLTVIASKEEGETASGSFSTTGGAASQAAILDRNYVKRQWFYLETPGASFDFPVPGFGTVYPVIDPTPGTEPIEVYVSLRTDLNEPQTYEGAIFHIDAYADAENNGLGDNVGVDSVWAGIFKKLVWHEDFELIKNYQNNSFMGIWLFQALDDKRALAVCYKASDGANTFDVGDFRTAKGSTDTDRRLAELICPPSDEFGPDSKSSFFPSTWKMMMRNVYSLGMSQINADLLNVTIRDNSRRLTTDIMPDSSGVSYLRVFGLDSKNEKGEPGKDGKIDTDEGIVYPELGYLMFPHPEPFNPSLDDILDNLDPEDPLESKFDYTQLLRNPVIYDTLIWSGNEDQAHSYVINVESATGQRVFQLDAFEIIENSEAVTVEGMGKLTRGVDYDIDYMSGTVTLKGERAAEIGDSKVTIDYQHKPLIGGGKSSLLGMSGELNLSRNARMNGLFIYNSIGAPKYNPRLGEEPSRVMAFDVNGSYQANPGWMTTVANWLPRVDTNAQSNFNINGEIAVSLPNPNVKGEAFVDDMEGIEVSNTISLLRRSWYESSELPASIAMNLGPRVNQESFYWYNPSQKDQVHLLTSRWDLNPNLNERERTSVTSVFLKNFDAPEDSWAGIMTGFPGGIDVTTAQYLEIWVNDFQPDSLLRGGTLHIDFGMINEDFFEPTNDELNDERNKELLTWSKLEDTGFRTAANSELGEQYCEYPYEFNNYDRARDIYPGINCRNNNDQHDTEDLNKNGRLDQTDAYYSLHLPLASTAIIDVQRDFANAGHYWNDKPDQDYPNRKKAWRMYRLQVTDSLISPTGVQPRLDAIQHVRIWVENADSLSGLRGQVVEITGIKFVGNRWEFNGIRNLAGDVIPGDTSNITIGIVNNKDFDFYDPPYRVEQENGVPNREQSLLFRFQDLADTTGFQAVKRFLGRGQDYQQYRELMFFLQADVDTFTTDFYLRIAYDSTNYYEIGVPLKQLGKNWALCKVNLADLTNLKLDAEGDVHEAPIRDTVVPSRIYNAKVVGSPTLFQVRYLYAGVRNRSGTTVPDGLVFFNDLKLGEVRRDIDHAEGVNFSANFANVLQFGASWSRSGPEFRSLQRKRGTGETNSNLSLNAKSAVNHFLPTGGFVFPISGRYNTIKSLPKYITQSDIEINESFVQDSLKSVNQNYSFNVSMSRSGSSNPLMKTVFDNLKTSFTYSRRNIQTPTSRDTTTTMSGNLNYQIRFKDRKLNLFKGIQWRYFLTNFTFISSASRKLRDWYSFTGGEFVKRPYEYSAGWNNELSVLYDPFESVKLDFGASEKRNLATDHYVMGIPVGVRTSYRQSLLFQFQPGTTFPIINEFRPRVEYTAGYVEDLNPSIRRFYSEPVDGGWQRVRDPFGTRNITGTRDINIVFDLNIGKYSIWLGEATTVLEKGEATAASASRRASSSSLDRTEEFQQWLEESRQAKGSDKAGQIESIPGAERPPPGAPPPTQPAEQEQQEQKPADQTGIADLGAKRPDEEDTDSTQEGGAEADTSGVRTGDPRVLLRHIFLLLGRIEPIKTTVRMDRTTYYPRVHERASLMYQLGLQDYVGAPGAVDTTYIYNVEEPERASDDLVLDFHTGVALTSNIDLDIRSIFRFGENEIASSVSKSQSSTWPALTLSWKGIERWSLLSSLLKQSSLTARFERKYTKTIRREETAYQFSPTWNMTWKNTMTTNVAFTYNQKNWMEALQEMWSKNWGINVDLRYSFEGSKGVGLPLPFLSSKKLTFKSRLDTTLNLSLSRTMTYKLKPTTVFGMSPQASYQFSNKIRGTLQLNYARTSGGQLGYVFHKIGMQVSLEFNF